MIPNKQIRLVLILLLSVNALFAQNYGGVYLYKGEESASGASYIKFTFLNQIWLRYADYNPGSTIFGNDVDQRFDIGLRRTRMQVFGEVFKNTFFYMQMGINNFSTTGARKPGIFFHDALVEYRLHESKLSLGAGLTGWNGLSRYSSPSIGSILPIDAPLFAQTTNDVTDQFLRKLSVYAKGEISKLNYRFVLTTPMSVEQTGNAGLISNSAAFASTVPNPQIGGYAFWQIFDKEKTITPYMKGTYLGEKKLLNIGAGFQYQKDAMWYLNSEGDTSFTAMNNLAIDALFEMPLDSNGSAVTVFASQYWFGFGPDYIRGIGAMNPANGNSDPTIFGSGTATPLLGTGSMFYGQLAYLFGAKKEDVVRVQPYMAYTHANYEYGRFWG